MTTNILIVGNGFDLSHYLPTKYDHFMVAMQAIEKWEGKGEMKFDDLFDLNHEKEGWFFQKTKEIYDTEKILLTKEIIIEMKKQLDNNSWYQYFKKHLEEIDTWIDFENQIQKLLEYFGSYLKSLSDINNVERVLDKQQIQRSLILFKLFNQQVRKRSLSNGIDGGNRTSGTLSFILNPKFCYREDPKNGFDSSSFLKFLQNQLNEFIEIFSLYLELIIDQLIPNKPFEIQNLVKQFSLNESQKIVNDWKEPDKIYSFNYTNSYISFYDDIVIEFLHGKFGKNQNIVLGVNDLENEDLKKLKAFGFTKYHQKLFKETDYLFLDSYKKSILSHREEMESFEREFDEDYKKRARKIYKEKGALNLDVVIWGHSLDVSDQDYIIDLFSLNDDLDRNVRVVVYYFDLNAKFALLNNLLAILGKDKVEHWMKNKWLKFEENPKIDFGITEIKSSVS